MKPIVTVALLLFLPASCTDTPDPAPYSTQMVRDSVVAVMNGLNAAATDKDVDRFMALWAPTDSLVYTRGGLTFIGWDEVAENHAAAFAAGGEWHFETAEFHVDVVGPDAGVATAFVRTGATQPDGTLRQGWFTITATVRQLDAGWRIVQAHGSYPEPGMTPRGQPETSAP